MTLAGTRISELSPTEAGLIAIVGVVCLAIACFNRQFYWAKLYGGGGNRPAPRWIGRLMFGGIGLLFVVLGIRGLLVGK